MVRRKTVLGTIMILLAVIFGGCSNESDEMDDCYEISIIAISDVGATGKVTSIPVVVTSIPVDKESPKVNDEIRFDLSNINRKNVKIGDKISIRIKKNHGGYTAHPVGIWTMIYFCEIEPC